MTQDILTLLSTDLKTIFSVCSLVLAVSLILYFKNRLVQDFVRFENKLNRWENVIEGKLVRWEMQVSDHITGTSKTLSTHAQEMSVFIKAINTDMLKIKENIFDLKQEMISKIDSLKDTVNYLEREFKLISDNMKKTKDQFDESFGRVINIRSEIDATYSRIMRLENDGKDLRSQYDKHEEWFTQINQMLKDQKEKMKNFKKI